MISTHRTSRSATTPLWNASAWTNVCRKRTDQHWPCHLRPNLLSAEDASNSSKIEQNTRAQHNWKETDTQSNCAQKQPGLVAGTLGCTWQCQQKLVLTVGTTWHLYQLLDPQVICQCHRKLVPQVIIMCWHQQALVPTCAGTYSYISIVLYVNVMFYFFK